jgi:hypothetical protein
LPSSASQIAQTKTSMEAESKVADRQCNFWYTGSYWMFCFPYAKEYG